MSKKKVKKMRSRRRKRVASRVETTDASDEEALDSSSLYGYITVALIFGSIGAVGGAIDGYEAAGLVGALISMVVTAVFVAIVGVIAVFLRGVVAACILPLMVLLVVGCIAYELIWGLPNPDVVPDPVVELREAEQVSPI